MVIRNFNMRVRNPKCKGRGELEFHGLEVYVIEGERRRGPWLVYHVNAWGRTSEGSRGVGCICVKMEMSVGKGRQRRGCGAMGGGIVGATRL